MAVAIPLHYQQKAFNLKSELSLQVVAALAICIGDNTLFSKQLAAKLPASKIQHEKELRQSGTLFKTNPCQRRKTEKH